MDMDSDWWDNPVCEFDAHDAAEEQSVDDGF
jgi:hypothetical protein